MMFAQAAASATVKLHATPQKFRAFYAIEDARIPISIRNQLARPARTARRGNVRWTIETDALIRTNALVLLSGAQGASGSVPQARLSFDDGLPVGGAVSRIADHLIDHQYNLTDLHGGPTRWGRYDEAYFETEDGREERALRSLELLSHLKVAYHMTGNSRHNREYQKLIDEMGYHTNTTTYLELRQELNYSDEELAMLSYYPLFRYEKNPDLLRVYP